MVPTVVPSEHSSDPDRQRQLNVESDRVHLIVTPVELDIVIDALRSVGNVELAARFEAVLRNLGKSSGRERHA
jgi:hypothetical protein